MSVVVFSDLHLGSRACQAPLLLRCLESPPVAQAERIVLAGDVLDSLDFRGLDSWHWAIWGHLIGRTKRGQVIWLAGNHEGDLAALRALTGLDWQSEYLLEDAGQRWLVTHGHPWDQEVPAWLCWLGESGYRALQLLDKSHTWARQAKHASKTYLQCAARIRQGAQQLRQARRLDGVVCGHTHQALLEGTYANAGCWTERPCTYLDFRDGRWRLMRIE